MKIVNGLMVSDIYFRPLRQTISWDTPYVAPATPHRQKSCDTNEATRIPLISEEGQMNVAGISSSSSENDNQQTNAWSSDYSNSEDEITNVEDVPVSCHSYYSAKNSYFYFSY